MFSVDLSVLSYKELQKIAVKCKIPGNIKKQLLVDILHFLKCGNNSEVSRMLAEIKKNRKKKKKLKAMKTEALNMSSSGISSRKEMPAHVQSRTSESNCVSVYRNQNADAEDCTLSVLCTDYSYSNGPKEHQPPKNHLQRHRVTFDHNVNVINHRTQRASYNPLNATRNAAFMSGHIPQMTAHQQQLNNQPLLQRMLQAPVGAELSLVPCSNGNGELSSASSTITASEVVEQEALYESLPALPTLPALPAESSDRTNNILAIESVLDCSTLDPSNNVESMFRLDTIPTRDPQMNCHEWIETTMMNAMPQPLGYNAPLNSTAMLPYRASDDQNLMNLDNSVNPVNMVQPSIQHYNYDNNQYFTNQGTELQEGDLLPDLQLEVDSNSYHHSPENLSYNAQDQYNNNQHPTYNDNSNLQYATGYPQQLQDNSGYSSVANTPEYPYTPGFYREHPQQMANENRVSELYSSRHEQMQQHVSRDNHEYTVQQQNVSTMASINGEQQVQEVQHRDPYAAAAAVNAKSCFDSYWPRWTQTDQSAVNSRTGGRSLENTLNLCTPNYVDYAKLNATFSVYSNKTPVMTLRRGYNSSLSSSPSVCYEKTSGGGLLQSSAIEKSPQRHNYNASNWLLYAGGSMETTTITDRKIYDPILPTSYGVASQHQPEGIF